MADWISNSAQNPSRKARSTTSHRCAPLHGLKVTTSVTVNTGRRQGLPRSLSSPKLSSLGKKRTAETQVAGGPQSAEAAEDMAVSFLQFCPTCENQIVVPNPSVLYCSESCRRKDIGDCHEDSFPPLRSSASSPPSTASGIKTLSSPLPHTRVVPAQAPSTVATMDQDRSHSQLSSYFPMHSPPQQHDSQSEMDPSEWKPSTVTYRGRRIAPYGSAALHFLAQFHRAPTGVSFASRRAVSADRAPSTSSAFSGHSSWQAVRTAPTLCHSSAGTSPAESILNTPKGDCSEQAILKGKAPGSEASLRSLAPVLESESDSLKEIIENGPGLEIGKMHEDTTGTIGTAAEGRLRRLLASN